MNIIERNIELDKLHHGTTEDLYIYIVSSVLRTVTKHSIKTRVNLFAERLLK